MSVAPNLRLWTIQLWMTDLEMNVLKSCDRLKQEIKYDRTIDFIRILYTIEQQISNLWVIGSNPIGATILGSLAQMARAPALQAGGREFESLRIHSLISRLIDFSFMVSLFDKVVNYYCLFSSVG